MLFKSNYWIKQCPWMAIKKALNLLSFSDVVHFQISFPALRFFFIDQNSDVFELRFRLTSNSPPLEPNFDLSAVMNFD